VPGMAAASFGVLFRLYNDARASSSAGGDMMIYRPMINAGDNPSAWTSEQGVKADEPGGRGNIPTPPQPPWGRVPGYCVLAGTKILMDDSSERFVENVRLGDGVMVWDEGCLRGARVIRTESAFAPAIQVVTGRRPGQLHCTPQHRVLRSDGEWIPAGHLEGGDRVQRVSLLGDHYADKLKPVGRVDGGPFKVYNLHVDHQAHNYIANSFVCHNIKIQRDPSVPYT
jgi:hypothetical protein